MRSIIKFMLYTFVAFQTGCAAGARIGAPDKGVGVGAAVGNVPPSIWENR